MWILDIKQRITSLLSTTPEKRGNKENPEGKVDKISLVNWQDEGRGESGREMGRGEREQKGEHTGSGR